MHETKAYLKLHDYDLSSVIDCDLLFDFRDIANALKAVTSCHTTHQILQKYEGLTLNELLDKYLTEKL